MRVLSSSSQRTMIEPMEVSDDSFKQMVIEEELPVLLYVWSSGCESCQIVGPAIIRLAAREVGRFRLVLADKNELVHTAEKYKITRRLC